MSNFNNDLTDRNPEYWVQNARFAGTLDQIASARFHGQVQNNVREYSIPRSQMVQLRENAHGGIPVFRGQQSSALPSNYEAGSRIGAMPAEISEQMGRYEGYGSQQQPQQGIRNYAQQQQPTQQVASRDLSPQDVQSLIMSRAMGGGQQQAPAQQQQMQQQQPQGRVATLIEGHTFYRALQSGGFATNMSIVRTAGMIAGVRGPVEIKNMVRAYNADGLQRIDAANIDRDTTRHMQLVVVQAVWTNGPVLVPMEAISENGYNNGNGQQQLLHDNFQRVAPMAQQQIQQQPAYNMEQMAMMQQQQAMAQARAQQQGLTPQQVQMMQQQRQFQQQAPQQQQQSRVMINDQASRDLLRRRGLLKG